jgi:hypothetical protein
MPEIPDISNNDISIRSIQIKDVNNWILSPSQSIPPVVPVTQVIGLPIVNIPGCVEATETNSSKNNQLREDDPNGTVTFCDSGVPSFSTINYEPDQMVFTEEAKVPNVKPPEAPKTSGITPPPVPPTPPMTAKQECPTREQQLKNPIGKVLKGDKKITGYELVGKECLMVTEDLTIPDQIIGSIPNAGMVTTTASIALVATTSALLAKPLADLLLKVVKPTVKKVVKKIASLRGKKIQVLSKVERQSEQRIRNHAIRQLRGKE